MSAYVGAIRYSVTALYIKSGVRGEYKLHGCVIMKYKHVSHVEKTYGQADTAVEEEVEKIVVQVISSDVDRHGNRVLWLF